MEFYTSRYKLDEAGFFLKKICEVYSKDDEEIEYYLDAFLNTCRSVIDYSLRDFLNSIKPPLKEKDKRWISNNRRRIVKENKLDLKHEKKDNILEYLKEHTKSYFKLKNQPLSCYFLTKRETIDHHEFSGFRAANWEQGLDGKTRVTRHHFEILAYLLLILEGSKFPNPDVDMCQLSKNDKESLIRRLTDEEASTLLQEYQNKLYEYVKELEQKACDLIPPK